MKKNISSLFATIGGVVAIVLWSTTVAVFRSLSEQLGPITSGASICVVSGIIAMVVLLLRPQKRRHMFHLSIKYLLVCGILFIGYNLVIYLAVGWANTNQEVLEVGLLNYMWPTLTIILSVLILKKKANWILIPGTVLALVGVFLVVTQGETISLPVFLNNLIQKPVIYSLAFTGAVSWALYSVLTSKWLDGHAEGGVALFFPVTALVMLVLCCFIDEPREWNIRVVLEALFLGTAMYVAYELWDNAMRKGSIITVAACSYMTPLLSTIVSCVYLSVRPAAALWVGCIILILGSILSWYAVTGNSE